MSTCTFTLTQRTHTWPHTRTSHLRHAHTKLNTHAPAHTPHSLLHAHLLPHAPSPSHNARIPDHTHAPAFVTRSCHTQTVTLTTQARIPITTHAPTHIPLTTHTYLSPHTHTSHHTRTPHTTHAHARTPLTTHAPSGGVESGCTPSADPGCRSGASECSPAAPIPAETEQFELGQFEHKVKSNNHQTRVGGFVTPGEKSNNATTSTRTNKHAHTQQSTHSCVQPHTPYTRAPTHTHTHAGTHARTP